jgi:hypothetical protein
VSASNPISAPRVSLAFVLLAAACGPRPTGDPADDTGLDGLALRAVVPGALIPGSTLVVTGSSFVDKAFGASRLELRGDLDGAPVELSLELQFVDYERLEHAWSGAAAAGFPADEGTFEGEAVVAVDSTVDGATHRSAPLPLRLALAPALAPRLDDLATGVIFVNEPITVLADGLLLGGGEGETAAVIAGCVRRGGGACAAIPTARVPVSAIDGDRRRGSFAWRPTIMGIEPGTFEGEVRLENPGGAPSAALPVDYQLVPPAILAVSPTRASLGQYVELAGGGFIGPEAPGDDSFTSLEISGVFTPEGGAPTPEVTLVAVPEFVSGPLVRYVLSEDDDLGTRIDLRRAAGAFRGTVRPVIHHRADTVRGEPTALAFDIAHVKQVVWLRFQPGYVESLRKFGLRAVDRHIRERVLAVARRDYAGVNLEFRTERPRDFALFSTVDIGGPDLNGLGYFGYDNTPGKDVDNQRLHDQIGGLNATTQEDGNPGYGGVFVESLFAFSMHPLGLAERADGASPLFDAVFDPFRPDRGGAPVLAGDLVGGLPTRASGDGCPASGGDRRARIACAVFVLGSLIGTTMTHEVGHSLGLAEPHGAATQYHNPGDAPDRLMDGGAARTFAERAELAGEGPSLFCADEHAYLRQILPGAAPAPEIARPGCD